MNELFNINRWLLLTGMHWSENRKKYLLSLVAIASLLLIWFTFMIMVEKHNPLPAVMQAVTYYVGLFLVGCLFASLLFADLASKPKATSFFMVPASVLEKLVCNLVYGVIFFFICYTLVFYLVDFLMIKVANNVMQHRMLGHAGFADWRPAKLENVLVYHGRPKDPNFYGYLLLAFIAVQAAFIAGSVYFPRYSFIKTMVVLLIFLLFIVFLVVKVLAPLMPDGNLSDDLTKFRVHHYENNATYVQYVPLPGKMMLILKWLFSYAFAPIFWTVAYFRLKEKQV